MRAQTRPSVCCFLSKKRDVRWHEKARYLRRDRRSVVFFCRKNGMSADTGKRHTWDATVDVLFFVERTGCPPTRKSDILETRPSVCCFLSKNRMSADTEIYNQTRLTGCPLTRKGEILETRPSVCCFLSKKRDVRRHGKARVMRRDRGESDLENAKNRVLLCLLACCCLNKVFEHFRGRKIWEIIIEVGSRLKYSRQNRRGSKSRFWKRKK